MMCVTPIPVVNVANVSGRQNLVGRATGCFVRQRLLEAVGALDFHPLLAIDLGGVEMISASAAREAFLGEFLSFQLERGTLPIFVNIGPEALEEFEFTATAMGLPIVVADGMEESNLRGVRIIGLLDSRHLDTLGVVARLGEADAKAAHDAAGHLSGTGVTAWNNRLSGLAAMRFLKERKVGKTKYYSLTLKGLVDGN